MAAWNKKLLVFVQLRMLQILQNCLKKIERVKSNEIKINRCVAPFIVKKINKKGSNEPILGWVTFFGGSEVLKV